MNGMELSLRAAVPAQVQGEGSIGWHRVAIAAAALVAVWVISWLVDRWLARRPLAPQAETRYRVLRRAVHVTILFVGSLSALLVIPQVRAIAGGILASTAVVGLVIGLAAQQVLSNFIAGIVIAVTQPVRIGDRVSYTGLEGVVEEIGMTYTFIRMSDQRRLVVPNSKLASEAIVNASIRSEETFAEVTIVLPVTADVDAALAALRDEISGEREGEVYLESLDGSAHVVVRAVAPDDPSADRLERDLRLRAHRRLRALGVWPD